MPASNASIDRVAIRPLSHASTNRRVLDVVAPELTSSSQVLDVGAGEGYFAMILGELVAKEFDVDPSCIIRACDVTPGLFRYAPVTCDAIDPSGTLPYPDGTFDVVCSVEVVEHVQNQFTFCRELLRVLRPGGLAVISTPNVLNMNSRYRTLHSGFATLFNPLSLSSEDVVHTSGHINPTSYYYLAYALLHAGARDVKPAFDRFKRSALLPLMVFGPILALGNALFRAKVRRKSPSVAAENAELLDSLNSFKMLTSRSIIAMARK